MPEPPDVEVYREALAARVAGGLDVFAARLRRRHHTAKRARTDSALFGGIGNAYSDELLRRARESPLALTWRMGDATVSALHAAARSNASVSRPWSSAHFGSAGKRQRDEPCLWADALLDPGGGLGCLVRAPQKRTGRLSQAEPGGTGQIDSRRDSSQLRAV